MKALRVNVMSECDVLAMNNRAAKTDVSRIGNFYFLS